MKHEEIPEICDELHDLIETERAALLDGNLEQVGRLFERKTQLIDALDQSAETDVHDTSVLRAKLERNQVLLASAADGVRSVARRLVAVRRVREALETYDEKGRRATVELKNNSMLEKRA